MKRRSFLKAVAVAAPAAGLQDFLVARAQAPVTVLPRSVARGRRRGGPLRPSPFPGVQLHSLQSTYQRNRRRPVRHGAHAPPSRWAAPTPAPESGGMVLRDGRRSGLPGRRAKAPFACRRLCAGSPPCAPHVFLGGYSARSHDHRLLSGGQNGAILPRCGNRQAARRGCGLHGAIRDGEGRPFSVLEGLGRAGALSPS